MEALNDVLSSVDTTTTSKRALAMDGPADPRNQHRQVKFAPELTTDIPPTHSMDDTLLHSSSSVLSLASTNNGESPLKNASGSKVNASGSKVKGTIPVTDFSDPNKINKVLVSSVTPQGGSADHTYAKDNGNSPGSSEDDSTSSDEGHEIKATPTGSQKPKQSSSRTRGRPRKRGSSNNSGVPLKSILKSTSSSGEAKVPYEKVKRRGRGCGNCTGCLREDCGTCCYCLDKPKFGGPGKKKQRCALRVCANFKSAPIRSTFSGKSSSVLSDAMKILNDINSSVGTSSASSNSSSTTPTATKLVLSNCPGSIASTLVGGATPTSKGPQPATPTSDLAEKQTVGLENNLIKCVVCGRERKASQSRSNKFCGAKCMKDWEMSNPGKNPEVAEPSGNLNNIPHLLQAAGNDHKQALPKALRNLQIDMALPGERRHDPTSTPNSDILDIGPLIQSISGNLSDSSSISPPLITTGFKRSSHQESEAVTPTKRPKLTTVSSPIMSPVLSPPVTVSSKHQRKPKYNQDVSTWSISDVVKYFEATDCNHIATIFREQEVDGEALLLLSHDSLVKCLGIKLGPALKVMTHVDKLKSGSF